MHQSLINRIVEGALLASNQPLTLVQLQELFPEDEPAPPGSVERALEHLREGCSGRGVELVEVASGFRFQITPEVHSWVARLWTERKTRYTRATLETLALIAYRQPITRGEIEQVRGVAVSSNIIQALEEREWIRVVGHRDVPGRPALFGTTRGFLDYFGLKRLDELPPLSELRELAELEPQLPLDNEGLPAASIVAGAATPDTDEEHRHAADADADAEAGDQPGSPDRESSATGATPPAHPNSEAEAAQTAAATDAALDGEPETAPGKRAVEMNVTEDNAVAKTTVAVDEADPEQQADAPIAGRSQVNE